MFPINKNDRFLIKQLLLFIFIFSSLESVSAYSPDLNSPRIGDELRIFQLKGVSETYDGNTDMSVAQIIDVSRYKVYKPAKEDTLTTMLIVTEKRNIGLVAHDNNLMIRNTVHPGESRYFSSDNPYIFPADSNEIKIESKGKIADMGCFETFGKIKFEINSNIELITLDCDTLKNAECLKSVINEIFVYENTDSLLHKGLRKQWYAPGYRYPLLELNEDYMITLDGDTVDYICRWDCMDVKNQEENIKDDPVNELLRNVIKDNHIFNNSGNNYPHGEGKPAGSHSDIAWDAATETIYVRPSLEKSGLTEEFIVCDTFGRVYAQGNIGLSDSFSLSMRDYPPGVYVFAVWNGPEFNTLKITKP